LNQKGKKRNEEEGKRKDFDLMGRVGSGFQLVALRRRPGFLLASPQGAGRLYGRDHAIILQTEGASLWNHRRWAYLNPRQIVMLQVKYLNARVQQPLHEASRYPTRKPVVVQIQVLHGRQHWRYLTGKPVVAKINGRDGHLIHGLDRTRELVPLQLQIREREGKDPVRDWARELVETKVQIVKLVEAAQVAVHWAGELVPGQGEVLQRGRERVGGERTGERVMLEVETC